MTCLDGVSLKPAWNWQTRQRVCDQPFTELHEFQFIHRARRRALRLGLRGATRLLRGAAMGALCFFPALLLFGLERLALPARGQSC